MPNLHLAMYMESHLKLISCPFCRVKWGNYVIFITSKLQRRLQLNLVIGYLFLSILCAAIYKQISPAVKKIRMQ